MSQLKTKQVENSIIWRPTLDHNGGPRFLQIADALQAAVAAGVLKPGDRLPPQRRLAQELNLDLTTITRAYEEARRRHLLEGRGAHGSYVAAAKVEFSGLLDLSLNTPPMPAGLDLDDMLKQGLAQVLLHTDTTQLLTYHQAGGSAAERQAGAQWLMPILAKIDNENIVVCPGAQAALAALILSLATPGQVILTEAVSYPGLIAAAQQFGRKLVSVASDQHGIVPEALVQACREYPVAFLYLNPTLHNPSTITMPAARRQQIADIAQKFELQIVEDDPYWLLADNPPAPLARLLPQQVCYIASLAKCLTPGLRLAYVVLPSSSAREAFLQALRTFALMTTPLTAALALQWLGDGTAQRVLAAVREEASQRQRIAHAILAGYNATEGQGLHLWLTLPSYWQASQFAEAAANAGLAVSPAHAFAITTPAPNAIRICLGSIRSRAHLQTALQQLSQLLAQRPACN